MTINISITADSINELRAHLADLQFLAGATESAPAPVEAEPARRTRKPKETPPAEAPKSTEAAELRRDVGPSATVVEPDPEEDDVLGEDPEGASEALTTADVRAILVELKGAFPDNASVVSTLVQKHAGAGKKLADVPDSKYPAIVAEARQLISKKAA